MFFNSFSTHIAGLFTYIYKKNIYNFQTTKILITFAVDFAKSAQISSIKEIINKNKKMSTKQTEQAPIAMDEVLSKSEAFVNKYKVAIIGAVVAIFIFIGGITLYNQYVVEPAEKEAAEALYPAQALFNESKYQEAIDGDGVNLGLIAIAEEYSSTKSGNLANAYAGIALAQLGKYEEAIDHLEKFDGDDQMVSPAAMGTLGNCYAQVGENNKAIDSFLDAAKSADNNIISPYYLLQAGIMYEQTDAPNKALDVYEQIKSKYPTSLQAMDIEKYINRVK